MKAEKAERKLREAKFFLDKMRDQECRAFGDKEPFDFYLSAFLNAGTSFRGEFKVRQDRNRTDAIKAWRKAWEDGLSQDDNALYPRPRWDHRSHPAAKDKQGLLPRSDGHRDDAPALCPTCPAKDRASHLPAKGRKVWSGKTRAATKIQYACEFPSRFDEKRMNFGGNLMVENFDKMLVEMRQQSRDRRQSPRPPDFHSRSWSNAHAHIAGRRRHLPDNDAAPARRRRWRRKNLQADSASTQDKRKLAPSRALLYGNTEETRSFLVLAPLDIEETQPHRCFHACRI
jgi:hypothetical protein